MEIDFLVNGNDVLMSMDTLPFPACEHREADELKIQCGSLDCVGPALQMVPLREA